MKKHGDHAATQAVPEKPGPEGAPPRPSEAAQNEAGAAETVSLEIESLKDQMLRLRADFENYRKRAARDRQELAARAAEDLLLRLLPVVDHFEIGLKTAREHGADPALLDGFQLVYDQFQEALKQAGLEPLKTEGQPFDPELHEAVSHLPSREVPADRVIRETRRGYRLGGKLLRAAQVVVSQGPVAEPPPPAATEAV